MSWWGKLFGGTFGFMLGGPLGALLGAYLGHSLDAKMKVGAHASNQERVQTAFFTATFSVMGHIAKADGRVSEDEIQLANTVMSQMQLNKTLRKLAQHLFSKGKSSSFMLDPVLDQLKRECHNNHNLLRVFLEIQFHAALADGELHHAEKDILYHICERLGFSEAEFEHLIAMAESGGGFNQGATARKHSLSVEKACQVLGVKTEDSDADIKKAYRRLLSQHHPDKLVAKGLPEEMMKLAAEKTHEIRSAYEVIREHRGF
ncbi:MAG: co-chaperone DjlA [Gammaproteobacteria bacterium]